jgi:hypothetical protein
MEKGKVAGGNRMRRGEVPLFDKESKMKSGAWKKRSLWILFAALALSAFSCGTIPVLKTPADWLHILPKNSSYYLCLNTGRTKDLIKTVIKKSPFYTPDIDRVVDLTEHIYLGVKLEADKKPALSIILLGTYPVFINSVFGWNSDWEEVKGETPYWRNNKMGLEASAPNLYIIIFTQEGIVDVIKSFQNGGAYSLTWQAIREMEANDFTLLFPVGLDDVIAQDLGLGIKKKIFEEIWLGGRKMDGKFYISGVFNIASDANPEAFKKFVQFIILALLRKTEVEGAGKRLNEMTFTVEERMVKVSNFYLTEEEFESFTASLLIKGLQ